MLWFIFWSKSDPQTIITMSNYIPLISSSLTGPLGIMHLPRLWQKVSLKATGLLHGDYPDIGGGYDSMVLGLSLIHI